MHRLAAVLALAFVLTSSRAHAESAQSHAAAARKAEKSRNWSRALAEWQAAYRLDLNADYLLGMGDAYAKLGDKENARKQYEAYLADPMAANTGRVKAKIAALDAPSLDLPGAAPGLPQLPAAPAAASAGNGLALPALPDAPAAEASNKRGKRGRKGEAAPALELPGAAPGLPGLPDAPPPAQANNSLALPLAAPAAAAPKKDVRVAQAEPLALPDLPVATAAAEKGKKGRSGEAPVPGLLDLPGAPPPPSTSLASLPPPAAKEPAAKEPPVRVAVASATSGAARPQAQPASTAAAPPPRTSKPAPPAESLVASPLERASTGSHAPRVLAYTTAGLAVASLAVGGLFYSKASQDQTDLTSQVRAGSAQQALLEQQKQHKSLAFAGLAAGLVTAGLAAALFAF